MGKEGGSIFEQHVVERPLGGILKIPSRLTPPEVDPITKKIIIPSPQKRATEKDLEEVRRYFNNPKK